MSDQTIVKQHQNLALLQAAASGNLKSVQELLNKGADTVDINYSAIDLPDVIDGMTPLLAAAHNGHLDVVRYLLKEASPKANPDVKDEDGDSLLHHAAQSNNLSLFEWVLQNTKLDINAKNVLGQTVQHLAAESGSLGILIYMKNKLGLDLKVQDEFGQNPLHLAALNGNTQTVQFLLQTFPELIKTNANGDQSLLYYAAQSSNLETISLVYQADKSAIKKTNSEGTPVHLAAGSSNKEAFKFLFERFPEAIHITGTNRISLPITHWITMSREDSAEKLEIILNKFPKALVNKGDKGIAEGLTPFLSAVYWKNYDAVKFLLTKYAGVNEQTDKEGKTALHLAIEQAISEWTREDEYLQLMKIIELIINHDPDTIEMTGDTGYTPLGWLLAKHDKDNVRVRKVMTSLLAMGFYIDNLYSSDLRYYIDKLFKLNPNKKLTASELELIQELGPAVNARVKEQQGNSLLHFAISSGNKELALRLLEAGALIGLKNDLGVTPWQIINENPDPYFMDLIFYYHIKQLTLDLEKSYEEAKAKQEEQIQEGQKERKEKEEKVEKERKAEAEGKSKKEDSEVALEQIRKMAPLVLRLLKGVPDFPKDIQEKMLVVYANCLAPIDIYGNLKETSHPVEAYQILRQIPKENKFYKEANKRMHYLLAKDLLLVPGAPGKDPVPKQREDALAETMKEGTLKEEKLNQEQKNQMEREVKSLEEENEEEMGLEPKRSFKTAAPKTTIPQTAAPQEPQKGTVPSKTATQKMDEIAKLTLLHKLVALSIAEPDAPEIRNYMAQYRFGLEKGVDSAQQLEKLQKDILAARIHDNPAALILLLDSEKEKDKLQRQVDVFKKEAKRVNAENERVNAENQRVNAEYERVNAEKQRLKAELEALKAKMANLPKQANVESKVASEKNNLQEQNEPKQELQSEESTRSTRSEQSHSESPSQTLRFTGK